LHLSLLLLLELLMLLLMHLLLPCMLLLSPAGLSTRSGTPTIFL
jgi:hypothetical protein